MSAPSRVPAIDVMRGLVMALMAVDHASEVFNRGRLMTDSVFMWKAGTPLPLAQFLTRWVTHLCAPTFVLLAGAALAMSVEGRRARGESERAIDRSIATRGALLVFIELAWMSWVMVGPGRLLFQVIWALGGSFLCMVPLRRLSDRALLASALVVIVGGEALVGGLYATGLTKHFPVALFASGGFFYGGKVIAAYPLLPWLGMMMLGWSLGRRVRAWGDRTPGILAAWGVAGIAIFLVLRGLNGYGNMLLLRESGGLAQWLHVSKYPPSLTFTGLELGITALVLAALFRFGRGRDTFGGPILVIGQTALFFYLIHIHLMELVGVVFGVRHTLGLASAWIGGASILIALYLPCRAYRKLKAKHPRSFLQYI